LLFSTPALVPMFDDFGQETKLLAHISLVDDESDDEVILLQNEKKRGKETRTTSELVAIEAQQ